ncbi:lytic transglycosylase domain-containing protein [Actinokineospora enzanensis]|uniref:lytic transglycosylase domain-containing protein n=1 Tax=Actinokineospora enzanensis TaxID=155975 RepID=UPI00036A7CF6|nr:lytic murein transglycosylase [Actinokineospora enzanensis]
MSARRTGGRKVGKHRQQTKRRRGAVAAAGALLLVPAVGAGAPVALYDMQTASALAAQAGGGLNGMTDPAEVGVDGSAPADDKLGQEVLDLAGNPDLLAYTAGPPIPVPTGTNNIPGTMLQAYMRAAQTMATTTPNCHLDWPLLASIGRIESNHARGGRVDATGRTVAPILGPVLNGGGYAAIADTDGGRYDGDARWDRAVGPMQFIPSTWRGYASDGNGDGQTDPNNVFDAALGAAKYLCSGGLDVSNPQQRAAAVFRYNHSDSYVRTVLVWADAYGKGVTPVADSHAGPVQQLALPAPVLPTATITPGPSPVPPPVDGVSPSQNPSVPPSTTTQPGGSSTTAPSSTVTQTTQTTQPTTTTEPSTTTPPVTTTPSCTEVVPTTTPTTTTTPAGAPTTPEPCVTPTTTPAAGATTTGAVGSALPTT